MSTQPILSILTTTRSDPRLISALMSVSRLGNYLSYEHIIQEAGQTTEHCIKYIQESHLCRYEASPDNGIYHGMNKCIDKARGIYCMVLNSDDELIASSLMDFASIISRCEYDIFLFDIMLRNANSYTLFTKMLSARLGQINHSFGMGYPHGGLVARADILRANKFNPEYGLEADYAQMLSLLSSKSYSRHVVSLPIQYFDISGASSKRQYFSRKNPHISHLKIIMASPVSPVTKFFSLLLRTVILFAVLPFHLGRLWAKSV